MLTLAPGSGVGMDPKIIAKSVVIAAVSHGRPYHDRVVYCSITTFL